MAQQPPRLAQASFWQADLTGCFLWGADMRHATFENAETKDAAFYTADLRHTELTKEYK